MPCFGICHHSYHHKFTSKFEFLLDLNPSLQLERYDA